MKIALRELPGKSASYYGLLALLSGMILLGLIAVGVMEHYGHIVTGMDNQIVWGLPHVFAVFLVVAASGALNAASMVSVFGKTQFKPLAPLSALLALALLLGGLVVLLLDLGRPDRLIVAITHFNFKSIFAWNIFLYSGFMALVIAYLWTQMERSANHLTPRVGLAAFIWRLSLTTGTGSIFGFLVARQAYDTALMAPMFIALSLSYGLAIFILATMALCHGAKRPIGNILMARLARLQIIFIAGGLFFVLVYHLTKLYATKHHGVEQFLLLDGGIHTLLFWFGQVALGSVLPMLLLRRTGRNGAHRKSVLLATALVVLGGLAQMYVTIIGAQAFPLVIFPGHEVSSSFADGVINSYAPTWPEWLLGLGGVAVAGIIVLLALKFLRFVPERLDDEALASGG